MSETPQTDTLLGEIDRQAGARFLDIIDLLMAQRPDCARLRALWRYSGAKKSLHRLTVCRREGLSLYMSNRALDIATDIATDMVTDIAKGMATDMNLREYEALVEQHRSNYYTTACSCGQCKIKPMTVRRRPVVNQAFNQTFNQTFLHLNETTDQ